ncbi:hypothetical protein M2322_004426 [Rhodoblastus acidophilus]|uniref:hypothetical protein n=1 Tax=Rhodoblastus acidophilus TaxID=1074 RepID=UPI002224DCEC|nr:hypothetical protein [Rhodoblastus acidophilus]MCW2318857.1 hypothetical protein [Rhodoblastus acidophilus]
MKDMRSFIFISGCLFASASYSEDVKRPALNLEVRQETIATTICTPGWTQSIRPYVSETKRIKSKMLAAIGEPIDHRNRYQLDHIIPLALGGAVVDQQNLALQPIEEARDKDVVERCLSSLVCQGQVGLEDAQSAIWEDWRKAAELCGGQ